MLRLSVEDIFWAQMENGRSLLEWRYYWLERIPAAPGSFAIYCYEETANSTNRRLAFVPTCRSCCEPVLSVNSKCLVSLVDLVPDRMPPGLDSA